MRSLLRHAREKMPDLELHLMDAFTGTIHEWLTSGRVDIAVLNPMRQNPAIRSEPLFEAVLYRGQLSIWATRRAMRGWPGC